MTARRPTGDAGNALVEFTYLAVLLMVPLVYVLLAGFQVQRAAFGVTEAARQAGRAYARADSGAEGLRVLGDQFGGGLARGAGAGAAQEAELRY